MYVRGTTVYSIRKCNDSLVLIRNIQTVFTFTDEVAPVYQYIWYLVLVYEGRGIFCFYTYSKKCNRHFVLDTVTRRRKRSQPPQYSTQQYHHARYLVRYCTYSSTCKLHQYKDRNSRETKDWCVCVRARTVVHQYVRKNGAPS